jgi:hypothetical protein
MVIGESRQRYRECMRKMFERIGRRDVHQIIGNSEAGGAAHSAHYFGNRASLYMRKNSSENILARCSAELQGRIHDEEM